METLIVPSTSALRIPPALQASLSLNGGDARKISGDARKTNADIRKKLARSQPEKSSVTSVGPLVKPKQSKSRNGCVTCKAKRLKCDETKPTCSQCLKRNVKCGGYKRDYKWRSFAETTFTSKPAMPRTRKREIPSRISRKIPASVEPESQPPESPGSSEASGSTITPPLSATSQYSSMQYSPSVPQTQLPESSSTSPTNKNHTGTDLSLAESLQHIKNESLCHEFSALHSTQTSTEKVFETKGIGQRADSTASNFPLNQSPRLAELLLPDTDLDSVPFDYVDNGLQYQPFGYIVPLPDELPDSEEVWRKPNLSPQARVSRLSSHSPSASSWSSSADNLLFDPVRCIYAQPKLHPASPEMLMLGFDTQTCGILSVKDGPTENPWRTLVWPLAQECPALYHAISSMTAFHTSKLKPMLKVEGMEHMRRSIRHLASGIENMRIDTALATTLVLAFSESWDVHVSTGIKHLRGAKVLVNQALTRHSHNSLNGEDFVRLKFLHNTWIYMDVIARLTNVDEDESSDLDLTMWHSLNGFGTSTEVDPLMGCACTLFPLIGSVANLVRRVRKSDSNSINIISQANDLKTLVETWEPPMFFEPPEDPTSEIQDSLQTAEAYRWATLLYLHQAVPEIPSLSATQLAKKALVYLATVPSSSRAIIVQIYPLLAAGCEASSAEDRAWVEERWRLMSQRMLIGNVDRCLEVVKEVWRRRDAYEAERFQHQSRRAASRMSSYLGSPVASIKRAFSVDEHRGSALSFDWTDSFGGLKRRITEADSGLSTPVRINRGHRNSFDMLENIEFEKTVRGRLHWVGVMKDWDWEVLLG